MQNSEPTCYQLYRSWILPPLHPCQRINVFSYNEMPGVVILWRWSKWWISQDISASIKIQNDYFSRYLSWAIPGGCPAGLTSLSGSTSSTSAALSKKVSSKQWSLQWVWQQISDLIKMQNNYFFFSSWATTFSWSTPVLRPSTPSTRLKITKHLANSLSHLIQI